MGYVRKSLTADEEIAYFFSPHWLSWMPRLAFYLALCVPCFVVTHLASSGVEPFSMAFVDVASAALGAGFVLGALWEYVKYKSIEFAVTTHRVIAKRGVVSRTTEEMRNRKVETVELKQGLLGRVLGYGDVIAKGTGSSTVALVGIVDPLGVKRKIEAVLDRRGG